MFSHGLHLVSIQRWQDYLYSPNVTQRILSASRCVSLCFGIESHPILRTRVASKTSGVCDPRNTHLTRHKSVAGAMKEEDILKGCASRRFAQRNSLLLCPQHGHAVDVLNIRQASRVYLVQRNRNASRRLVVYGRDAHAMLLLNNDFMALCDDVTKQSRCHRCVLMTYCIRS